MTDERLAPVVTSWLKGSDSRAADPSETVRRAMGRVHETRQVGRWWPPSFFDRLSVRAIGVPSRELAPAPIPATNGPTPVRGSTMFSAPKFIAAGVIVALVGGFLLAGVLTTQQGEEMAPAAVTESPSPMTAEGLLSGMVTEEVERGVLRVVNDGVRDLSSPDTGYPGHSVDVTPDGSVWLSGPDAMYRLGGEVTLRGADPWPPYKELAPDGSLWAFGDVSDFSDGIFSFDGEGWTERATTTGEDLLLGALAIGPDGTVWVAASDRDKYCPDTKSADCIGTVLLRLEDDGSLTVIDDWGDLYAGDVAYDELAVSPDGDVWLIGMVRWDGPEAEALLRFDGEGWEVIPGPEGFLNHTSGNSLDIGPDGTLWVNTNYPEDGWPEDGDWRVGGLARFDDPGWTAFTEADGVQDWGGQGFIATDLLRVAPDGSLWLNGTPTEDGCGGVAHYDGTTWTSYLVESCIHDLAIAPDGSIWVQANAYRWDNRDISGPVVLYVITPEAAAATE